MSNKKRRNRKILSDSSEVLGQTIDQPSEDIRSNKSDIQSVQAESSGKTGVISYLKSNLWLVGLICFLALGTLGAGLKYLDESAQQEITRRANSKGNLSDNSEQSFLNKVNPFLSPPDPTPTPQLSKEYIYAGSRLLAVEDANANAAPPADLAIWRPGDGNWWVMGQTGSQQVTQQWGVSTDKPVPGDYDGDGKTDFAVFRPSDGVWYVINSSGGYNYISFGQAGDIPAQADFDGDGKTDAAFYRPDTSTHLATWYIRRSSDGNFYSQQFGIDTDLPAAADYDGDGKADIGVWRNSATAFYSVNSSNYQVQTPTLSQSGDKTVSADYDGDGKADYAVYNSSTATWYIRQSTTNQVVGTQWGAGGDTAVQNDYDGDGKVDIAVWHAANGVWTIRNSATNTTRTAQWGGTYNGIPDIPVPAFYRR